ncbi:MAG: DinB family protein [Flavobacteriaceae bacterium]|nr:DinB family protein [Flavobacteriaceae bacterium]
MNSVASIISELDNNLNVFNSIFKTAESEFYMWRPQPDKWNLLEILCHLYDEERLDFRFRVKWVLERPNEVPPPFNPIDWVTDHDYAGQDFFEMLKKFNTERQTSIEWLNNLRSPNWAKSFDHPKLGKLSANYFFKNWLAHDYLHLRQIIKQKFDYLEYTSGTDLGYAGTW